MIFNPVVGREDIDASSFPRPPNVFQSTMGTAGGCHGILLQCLEIFALCLDPCREWPPCSRTFYNNYAHGFTVRKDPPQRDECAVMSALPSTFRASQTAHWASTAGTTLTGSSMKSRRPGARQLNASACRARWARFAPHQRILAEGRSWADAAGFSLGPPPRESTVPIAPTPHVTQRSGPPRTKPSPQKPRGASSARGSFRGRKGAGRGWLGFPCASQWGGWEAAWHRIFG